MDLVLQVGCVCESGRRNPVRNASGSDLRLGARDALPHRRVLDEERVSDFCHCESADDAKCQRHACVERKGRVAAGEQQPQPIVFNDTRGSMRFRNVQHERLPMFLVTPCFTSQPIDRFPVCGRGHPSRRVRWNAMNWPMFDGGRERVGGHLFSQIEVAVSTSESRDDPRPLFPMDARDHRIHLILGERARHEARGTGISPWSPSLRVRSLRFSLFDEQSRPDSTGPANPRRTPFHQICATQHVFPMRVDSASTPA